MAPKTRAAAELEAEWADRVRANRVQAERVREDKAGDFYAPVSSLFVADPRFLNSIKITFYFTALGVAVQTLLGVTMALAFNREFWGRGLLRTLAILPMVATPVAIALIFVMMFHPTLGVMNFFVTSSGMPLVMSVSMNPGAIALTVIFCRASSRAATFVSAIRPALLAA